MTKETRYAYYQKINRSSFKKLLETLYDLEANEYDKNIIECIRRCRCKIEDAITDRYIEEVYLIIHYAKISDPILEWDELTVINFTIWKYHPNSYLTNSTNETSKYIECYSDKFPILAISCNEYTRCVDKLLSKLNKNENRLQEQESSGQRPESGCILYGGGDGSQLTTGRHCDQARIEEIGERFKGSEIVISPRRTEILRG